MFRDRQEELERLQQQLLEEETEEPEEEPGEEYEEVEEEEYLEAELEDLLSADDQGENPRTYHNYSNDYGRQLRNFASGYQAYNTDQTDEDLEAYSQEVYEPKKEKGITGLLLLAAFLLLGIAAVLCWLMLRIKGWI